MQNQNHIGNRQIAARVARATALGAIRRRTEFRFQLIREMWTAIKRFAYGDVVRNLDLRELPQLRDAVVEGFIDDRNRVVLAALCRALGAGAFFEIGTNRGRTAWTVARSVEGLDVYTLDLPDPRAAGSTALELIDADQGVFAAWQRGDAFADSEVAGRIHPLLGDSAAFDYSEFEAAMDVVFIDGSHSYPYVSHDTATAVRLLRPGGAIVWDDYPGFPGVVQAVVDAARWLDGPIIHVLGTRLAIWSDRPLDVEPIAVSEHRSVSAA